MNTTVTAPHRIVCSAVTKTVDNEDVLIISSLLLHVYHIENCTEK